MTSQHQKVHIEFQRVQTWLFAVPRLRAMVGANAMLGEALRLELPALARQAGQGWCLAPCEAVGYPQANPDDPLKEHGHPTNLDDPAADARDGILSRDGGHFEANFASGAKTFAAAAAQRIRALLPGLRFKISIDDVEQGRSSVHISTELPVFAPCAWTGRGLASDTVKQGNQQDDDAEEPEVSLDVKRRHDAAQSAENWEARDLATLLSATTKLKGLDGQRVKELQDLVGSGYFALIHADGNAVGAGAKGLFGAERADFFHRSRVLLRRAAKAAIDLTCESDPARDKESQAPLIPLMLGGDDLLLVCRARVALPFVVGLCQVLQNLQQNDASAFKLTLGVGVVIAKHKIPIHRLHEVAEQLAGSAKRRFRGLKDAGVEDRSVVDWAVCTTTWLDSPENLRKRDWVRGHGQNLRVLSQRPLDVLGSDLKSLQGLVSAVEKLDKAKPPRSQLRYLVDQLPHGRALAELAFAELSEEARKVLKEVGVTHCWEPPGGGPSPLQDGLRVTSLLDLIETFEIAVLGRKVDDTQQFKAVAHV